MMILNHAGYSYSLLRLLQSLANGDILRLMVENDLFRATMFLVVVTSTKTSLLLNSAPAIIMLFKLFYGQFIG